MNFDWITEIKDAETHIKNSLNQHDDLADLYKIIKTKNGDEAFAAIYESFLKTSIRFPESPINSLKKIYVLQNLDKPVAKTARILRIDEATVFSWIREINGKSKTKNSKSRKDILRDLLD